jgi:hypothetical protein
MISFKMALETSQINKSPLGYFSGISGLSAIGFSNDLTPCRMAFYFVFTFAIAQTPTKQPALRLSRTKNLHFAKATFPGFSAKVFHLGQHGRDTKQSACLGWDAQNKLSQK